MRFRFPVLAILALMLSAWLSAADPAAEVWWSYRPLKSPAVPPIESAEDAWRQNPIDAFVLAKLREKELSPAPRADRWTLIRRVTFDLIGLPPTPEEVTAFVND